MSFFIKVIEHIIECLCIFLHICAYLSAFLVKKCAYTGGPKIDVQTTYYLIEDV
jgi:hypothetical protein